MNVRRRLRARGRSDRGAALVEFAIIAPLLFALVFGIIEFGWGFAQYLDVRHGAREGARLAAVNYADPGNSPPSEGGAQTSEIIAAMCDRMGGDAIDAEVELTLDGTESDPDDNKETGDIARISVESDLDTLTGFLDFALAGITIDDEITFRLERDVDWNATAGPVGC